MDEFKAYLLERKKKKGYLFIPYLALGDPNWEVSFKLAQSLLSLGADSLELGLPFSDPSADGVVLQRAFKRALKHPFHWDMVFHFLEKLSAYAPQHYFLLMGYANVFYQYGFKKLFAQLYQHRVRGIVIPDVPFEEKQYLIQDQNLSDYNHKMAWIDFITPTTTLARLQKIAANSRGFLYIVSYKGTTGGTEAFSLKPIEPLVKELRHLTTIPLMIGFGIRQKAHAAQAIALVDGFIVGSRIHEIIEANLINPEQTVVALQNELHELLPC